MLLILAMSALVSCDRDDFADMNTNPDAILSIPPEYEFTSALLAINNNSFEYYYDYNRAIYYWAQSFVTATGNSVNVYDGSGNLNNRNGIFYGSVGNKLTDVRQIIDKMTDQEKKAQYVHLRAIAGIPLAYYAWYNSDVNGSIAYTEGFKARYTIPALLTPKYDTQEALYDTLDNQLKAIVAILKTSPAVPQADLKSNDVYYGGDATKWIKAANSLRLRMAFRLMKRKPEKLKAIAQEVLSDPVGLISSTAEDWKFVSGKPFTGGNYNPTSNSLVTGSKNMIDFMWQTKDPRIRVFYQPSSFTKARFDAAQAQGKIPASFAWDGQLFRGQFADPDANLIAANAIYFANITFTFNGAETSGRLPSSVQSQLFFGNFNTDNPGNTTFPIITYADVCFMRAELALRNITGTDAEGWYYKGIDASLSNYEDMARTSILTDYVALSPAEVVTYKEQPGVKYDPANALEQVLTQQYINFFKNQNEAWALIKRTGYPSVTGKYIKLEKVFQGGAEQAMPRRFSITPPTVTNLNFENIKSAIEEMQKDPGFGAPTDIKGRVWWDKP